MIATEAPEQGDLDFARLLGMVVEPGYRLACGMLHDPPAAEDAVQEAALKAWRKIRQLRDGKALRPWFLAIVANECKSMRRTRWWSELRESETPPPVAISTDQVDRAMDLRRALRKLDTEKRLAMVLYWYLDLPLEEIALITGGSVHAVESRLQRGKQELRRQLEERRC